MASNEDPKWLRKARKAREREAKQKRDIEARAAGAERRDKIRKEDLAKGKNSEKDPARHRRK